MFEKTEKIGSLSVLQILDIYPGSRIRLFSIPDPGSQIRTVSIPDPGSRIPDPDQRM
jgi:hypothetical protein